MHIYNLYTILMSCTIVSMKISRYPLLNIFSNLAHLMLMCTHKRFPLSRAYMEVFSIIFLIFKNFDIIIWLQYFSFPFFPENPSMYPSYLLYSLLFHALMYIYTHIYVCDYKYINTYVYMQFVNITCSVHIMLPVCMFPGLTTLCTLSWRGSPPCSQLFSVTFSLYIYGTELWVDFWFLLIVHVSLVKGIYSLFFFNIDPMDLFYCLFVYLFIG